LKTKKVNATKIKYIGVMVLLIMFSAGMGVVGYYMYGNLPGPENEEFSASPMSGPMGALFGLVTFNVFFGIVIFLGRKWINLGIKDWLYGKTGIVTQMVDSSGNMELDIGPSTRKVIFESEGSEEIHLAVRLGNHKLNFSGTPWHVGVSDGFFSADLSNLMFQRLLKQGWNIQKFKEEFMEALGRSRNPDAVKLWETEKIQVDKGKTITRYKNPEEINKLKELDLLDAFPKTTLSLDFESLVSSSYETGKQVSGWNFLKGLFDNKWAQYLPHGVLIFLLLTLAFSYSSMDAVQKFEPTFRGQMDQLNKKLDAATKELKEEMDRKVKGNQALLPSVLEPDGGGGDE